MPMPRVPDADKIGGLKKGDFLNCLEENSHKRGNASNDKWHHFDLDGREACCSGDTGEPTGPRFIGRVFAQGPETAAMLVRQAAEHDGWRPPYKVTVSRSWQIYEEPIVKTKETT